MKMWIKYNANPVGKRTNDCVIRAISTVLKAPWDKVHDDLCALSSELYTVPSDNDNWATYLDYLGFYREDVPHSCPEDCITVKEFAKLHKYGQYLLNTCEYEVASNHNIIASGSHLIALINGNWYDTWNSGGEAVVSYWFR